MARTISVETAETPQTARLPRKTATRTTAEERPTAAPGKRPYFTSDVRQSAIRAATNAEARAR